VADSKTVYAYQPDANLYGDAIPGVPLRDLTDADLAQLPAHLVASIAASPLYRRSADLPRPAKAPAGPRPSETKEG
jgi:hypothetical protein